MESERADFDSPWKEVLDFYFEQFLLFFFPHIHAAIDWSHGIEPLDKELQQIVRKAEVGRRTVDKLVKVWRVTGEEEWVLVHVEIQSQTTVDFPHQMYVYNFRLYDRYNRQVCSLAVLADDQPNWRPNQFGYNLWDCEVSIRYPIVKLLDYANDDAALVQSRNPFAKVVLAHLKTHETHNDPEAREEWKVRITKGLYDLGWSAADVGRIFRILDWMMALPADLERRFWQEIDEFEREKQMPYVTSVERIGIEKGRAEGMKEGMKEGLKEGMKEGILLALDVKFGAAASELAPDVERLLDIDGLRSFSDAIKQSSSLDVLRQRLAEMIQGQTFGAKAQQS